MLIDDNFARRVISVPHYVDGDTVDLVIDLGFDPVTTKKRIRFEDIDTPERGKQGFDEAAKFTHEHLKNAREAVVVTDKWERGSFRRWIATIYIYDGEKEYSLNKLLLEKHLAVPYIEDN